MRREDSEKNSKINYRLHSASNLALPNSCEQAIFRRRWSCSSPAFGLGPWDPFTRETLKGMFCFSRMASYAFKVVFLQLE